MQIKSYKIKNKLGLHARSAALFVETAGKFNSEIQVEKDGMKVNGKSIMGLLMLAVPKDSLITIKTKGDDEKEAIEKLGKIIEDKFGEE